VSRWTRRIIIIVVILAVVGGGFLFIRGRIASQMERLSQFATATVDRGDVNKTLIETGSIVAAREVQILPETTGEVVELNVQPGQHVEEGATLIKLENEALMLQLRQAELDYQLTLQRLADVLGVSPEQALNTTLPDRYELTAGASGRVTEVIVRTGQNVTPGTPLARVVDDGHIIFVARVNKQQMERVQVGQQATVFTDGFAMRGIAGTVTAVDRHGAPEDGGVWYDVDIAVKNPGALKAGMHGQADIKTPGGTISRDGTYRWREPQTLTADRAGLVEQVLVDVNDWVDSGDAVAEVSGQNLGTQVRSERVQVEKARLNLRLRQLEAEKLTVTSPIAGIVSGIDVEVGDQVSAGGAAVQAGLITVTNQESMEITVEIDELDVINLHEGQPVTITVNALPGKTYQGEVTSIAVSGTARTGVATFAITISVTDPEGIRPGMTGEVTIPVEERTDVVRVPSEAVTVSDDGVHGSVLVIGPEGAEQRQVEIGLRTETWTEITSGLEPGDEVVTARADTMQDFFGQQPPRGGGVPPH